MTRLRPVDVDWMTHEDYLVARLLAAIEAAYPTPRRPGQRRAAEVVVAYELFHGMKPVR